MALRHGLTSSTRCLGCRAHVLRAFITSLAPTSSTAHGRPLRPAHRTLHAWSSRRSGNEDPWKDDGASELLATQPEAKSSAAELGPAASAPQTPWYLEAKEQRDLHQDGGENPFAERQRIPELPPDPPPMLDALLKHVSIDIGLDYLTLLDLRKMDPPPALGTNLLMIFGTARSERHLNVSADRLCRWLRTTYKLRPVADGLLGRNELKLKLRRKNRRAKMLGAAGAVDPGNYDDGIHTGWICVNVGAVEGATEMALLAEDDDFVGFGREDRRPKIVVQIMTEEKRGQVELETLWQTAYDRSMRREKARQQEAGDDSLAANVDVDGESENAGEDAGEVDWEQARLTLQPQSSQTHERPFLPTTQPVHQQTRQMHTSARRANLATELDEYELEPHLVRQKEEPLVRLSSDSGKFRVPPSAVDAEKQPARLDGTSRALQTNLDFLYKLDRPVALRELGVGENDRSSTSFLSNVHSNLPVFLEDQHWRLLARLHTYALKIGHRGYTRSGLLRLVRRMHGSLLAIPQDILMDAFTAMLCSPLIVYPDVTGVADNPTSAEHAMRHSLALSFEVLEKMDNYGYDVCSDEVFLTLHDAISHPRFVANEQVSLSPQIADTGASEGPEGPKVPESEATAPHLQLPRPVQDGFHYHLRQAMKILNPGPLSHRVYTALLETYASQEHWPAFWSVWRDMAQQMVNRTPDMYVAAFRGTARGDSKSQAQRTLREIAPQLAQERPPVELAGGVAVALGECLRVAQFDQGEPFGDELKQRLEAALNQHLLELWASKEAA